MFIIKLIMLLIISFAALPVAFVVFWITTMRKKKSLEKKLQMLQQNLNMLYETGQISSEVYQNILKNCELSEGYYVAPENGRQPENYHVVTENIRQPKDYHAVPENGRPWEDCHNPSENNKSLEGYQRVPENSRPLEETQFVQEPYVPFPDSAFTPSMEPEKSNSSFVSGEPSNTFTENALENKKTGAVIGFSLGVLFIFLAGILFSVTNWQNWSALEKIGIVFGAGAVCYGLSGIAKKVLALTLTCEAFYTLGSILAMLGVYAMGFYGMFGEYLSPGGNAAALYFLCICLLELCFTLGYYLFRDTLYKILCATGLTLSVIWGGIAFCPSMGEMVLLLCIFSAVVLGICLRYYRECRFLQHYSLFNLCISGIAVFLYYVTKQNTSSYNCLIQAAGLLLLAVSFLFLNISKTYSDFDHVTSTVSVSLLVSAFLTILLESASGVLPFMCLFTFLSFALIFVYGFHLYSHEQENAPKAWFSMKTGYGVLGILCQGISILLILYQQFEKEKVTLECMIFSGIAVLIYFGFYAFLKKVHLIETKNVFGYFRLSEHSVYGTFLLLFFYTMVLFYFGVTLGKASYCISTCIGLGVISLLFVPAIRKGGFWGFVACHGGNIYLLLLFLMVYAQTKISGWYFLVLWVCTAFYGYWNVQFGKKCYAVLEQVNLVIFVLVFLADYDILKDNYAVVLSLLTVSGTDCGILFTFPSKTALEGK